MNRPAHDDQQPAPRTAAELLDDVQTQIGELLTALATLAPLVDALTDTRQPGLGFLTAEGRQIQNRIHQAERTAMLKRLEASKIATWAPGVDIVDVGPGFTPTPGNTSALSSTADLTFTLHHHARYLVNLQARDGVCTLIRIPTEPTALQLIAAIRRLVWQTTSLGHLEAVRRDLEQLLEATERLVDGPREVPYPNATCPNCGRPTLVATFVRGVIESVTCDRDQTTGDRHPCTCPDPLCECKSRPVAYRHTWHRTRARKPDGLLTLTGRINQIRAADADQTPPTPKGTSR